MKRTPKTASAEAPHIYADHVAAFSIDEKQKLRGMLNDPTFIKLLRMATKMKPSSNVTKAGSYERDEFSDARANARLGEIRGWEMFQTAIFAVLVEQPKTKSHIEESFPDSGQLLSAKNESKK